MDGHTVSGAAGRKAGLWMLSLAWIAGLILASRFFADWEQKAYNPNTQPISRHQGAWVEVVLRANAQGHFFSTGRINNQAVVFLLDTGATDVAIPMSLSRTLGLEPQEAQSIRTANGIITGRRTHIDRLSLGDIVLRDVRAILIPDVKDQSILLGMSALKQLEFTQRDGTLVLRQAISEQHD